LEVGREQNPMTSLGAELAGAIASPASLLAGPRIANAASIPGRVATGVAAGAAGGATYGYLDGQGGAGERLNSGVNNMALPAAIGGAIPLVGGIARAGVNAAKNAGAAKTFVASAPTNDALRKSSKELFAIADQSPTMSREAWANSAEELADTMRGSGLSPRVTPAAAGAMDDILESGNLAKSPGVTFRELDQLRAVAGNVAKKPDASEASLGLAIRDGIDDFLETYPDAGPVSKEARALWGRMRNSELVQEAMEKAKLAASGFENGLRNEFRAIVKRDIGRNRLPKELKAAMVEVIDGTRAGNVFKKIGRMMGPGRNQQSNMLGMGLSSGAGAAILAPAGLAPLGAAIAPIIGHAAQTAAERTTLNAANRAAAVAAAGKAVPRNALANVAAPNYLAFSGAPIGSQ